MAEHLDQHLYVLAQKAFGITRTRPVIDVVDLDGTPSNAELEDAVLALIDALDGLVITKTDST